MSLLVSKGGDSLRGQEWWSLLALTGILVLVVLLVAAIWRQPQNSTTATFMVRGKPVLHRTARCSTLLNYTLFCTSLLSYNLLGSVVFYCTLL